MKRFINWVKGLICKNRTSIEFKFYMNDGYITNIDYYPNGAIRSVEYTMPEFKDIEKDGENMRLIEAALNESMRRRGNRIA